VLEGSSINCERFTPETLSLVVVAQLDKAKLDEAIRAIISLFIVNSLLNRFKLSKTQAMHDVKIG
jgi:hypothetical protein